MMKKAFLAGIALLALLAAADVAVTLVTETSPRAEAACQCPLIYAPVVCDRGKTFPNQCVADCRNAKNCVPSGAF